MVIKHERYLYNKNTTLGKLYIDNRFFCYTLEDTVRAYGIKVKDHTAIPANEEGYKVGMRYSPGFKRDMLILYTENDKETLKHEGISFKYIYAHGGNTHEHTEGCVLVASEVNEKEFTIYNTVETRLRDIVRDTIESGEEVKWVVINKSTE